MSYYVRRKKGNTVQVHEVRSVRRGKDIKQEYVRYVGVEKETENGDKIIIPSHKDVLDRIELTDNVHLGDVMVLNKLAEELKIAEEIDKHSIKGGGIPSGLQLLLMAINHAIQPTSLNGFSSWYEDTALPKITGIRSEKLNKDNLCSAMDGICREIYNNKGIIIRTVDKTIDICKGLVNIWSDLFNISLESLYYDITSTYFEGAKCILAKLGYSRDKKRGKVQINIALIVTKEHGFPICFMIYEGNTNDQKTVNDALKFIKEEFGIKDCTIVWDRGMVSKKNMNKVNRMKQKIICGLKSSETDVKKILKSVSNEELIKEENIVRVLGDGHFIYATNIIKKLYGRVRNIVVYINTQTKEEKEKKRTFKLRSARIKLGKYRAKLNRGNYQELNPVISHYKKAVKGVSRFFKAEYKQEDKITIDWVEKGDKIKEALTLDGKYALMATDKSLNCQNIIDDYFNKDAIEKAFRCMKHIIKIHPTRHWLANRVKVHVFICYLSYLLLKALEYKLRKGGMKLTGEKALEELGKIKQGVIIDPTTQYSVLKVARLSESQKEILSILGMSGYINSES